MDGRSEPLSAVPLLSNDPDFGVLFQLNYARVVKIIARIIADPGRAEELAAEVFWRCWRNPTVQTGNPKAWLYRAAAHRGLDELRRQKRRERFEQLLYFRRHNPTPEQLHETALRRHQVRQVLSTLRVRDAELLILRSDGFSYQEIAEILQISSTSIGTLTRRAQQAFRKEYVRRYGLQD